MSLQTPRLDDRSFDDLVEEARARIPLYAPEWTDHNLSDPGITLIELFAYMMDIVLYRLNRVPDKHFIKFMELIGMRLHEATPARAEVTFWLSVPQPTAITIPADVEVSTTRTESDPAIVFTTDGAMEIKVPEVSYLLTSYDTPDGRVFEEHDVVATKAGLERFPIFASEPPKTDDALYIGFEQDLSQHILGIQLEVDTAEGAGIDPNNPPYVWEAIGGEFGQQWVRIEVDLDNTLGLNVSGSIRLHLPDMHRTVRNDITAYWIRCRLDLTETESRYDASPRISRLDVASWGATVRVTNVTRVREEVLGRSDGSPGQVFYLEHVPLVARTSSEYLIVRHDNGREERWQEVSDFSTSTGTDHHYTIDSNTGEVRLGPALPQPDGTVRRYGALPPKGTMLVMSGYRYGGGQVGNVAAKTINVLRTSIPYISRVLNRQPATGGRDAEAIENAKMRVPGYLRSLQRAVTAADFEYLAQQAAPGEIGRVYCLQPPLTNRGENKILVIPHIPVLKGFIAPESLELSVELRNQIQSYLDERRLLSARLEVTMPAYQWVETEVRFRVSQHYDFERVRRAIEDKLFEFINPLSGGIDGKGWPFGRDLLSSDVMAVLSTVPGVNFIRSVKLYPVTYENRQFRRGAETQEIPLPSHGLVVSFQHQIFPD